MTARELRDRVGALLLEHAPSAVALLDRERRIVLANPAFVRTFGEPAGRSCHEAFRGLAAPCADCHAGDAFAGTGAGAEVEERGVDRSGAEIFFRAVAAPLPEDNEGRVLLVTSDLTALHALRAELREAEQLAAVGLTVAGLAHTIKNILLGLEGATYLVEAGIGRADLERVKGGWGMVTRYLDQVTALVKNLLSYARPRELERKTLAAGDLCRAAADLYRHKAELAGIEIAVAITPDLPPIVGDEEALMACLGNLVTNALDACVWDPDHDKPHRIELRAGPGADGRVALAVSDNGPGITPEHQRKILAQIFTTKGMRGTGLGLLLTRKAVEAHGGRIAFSTAPGVGTTFTIELPPAPVAAPAG